MSKIFSAVLAVVAAVFFLTPVANASEASGEPRLMATCVRMSGPSQFNQACIKVDGNMTHSGFFVERVSGGMVTGPEHRILCDVKVELYGIFANNIHWRTTGIAPCGPNLVNVEQFPKAEFRKDSLICAKVTFGTSPTSQPVCYTIGS